MAFNFFNQTFNGVRQMLNTAFSSGSSGHGHDGSDSKLITMEQTKSITIETLAAGVDIADRVLAVIPTGKTYTLTDVKIISQGSAVGIDAGNTCVVALKNGSNAIFTQTYNNTTVFPAAGSVTTIASLSSSYKALAADALLKLSVTNGATANPPQFMLQLTYTTTNA